MNENDFDVAAAAWLEDGPTRMSERALLAALEEIHATRQRRAIWPAWRTRPVSIFARMGFAAALVVAVGALAINIVQRQPDASSVGGPSRSLSPSAMPSQAVDFPAMTSTFVSPTYGYSFKYLDRGGLAPATARWDPAHQPIDDRNLDARFDAVETGYQAYFEAASTPLPDGVSTDAFVDEYITQPVAGGCGVPRRQQIEIIIDGQPGKMMDCGHSEATVVAGGRLYLFRGPGDSARDKAWFAAWIATIDLRPEDAAVPSSAPS